MVKGQFVFLIMSEPGDLPVNDRVYLKVTVRTAQLVQC